MAEILAPCGSREALDAALRTGCTAVYLGGEAFSARQNAANFDKDGLKNAVYGCHVRGVKVYQAINTIVTDGQLEALADEVKAACEIGVDGLITQDLALVRIVRECCPDMEIHASTQMTLHTERGVLLAKETGFSRAVVSRELNADIIKQLCTLPVETEVFVHGALCMSVSGQCYMSAVIGSRSANRGLCAQACRLPASAAENQTDRYDLSLKDMSYMGHIRELEEFGAASFKIEGRMKRPEYVACAVDSLRKALNGEKYDIKRLENVFSRSGFTDGYYTGRTGRKMFGYRQKEDVISSAEVIPQIHELYRQEYKRSGIYFYIRIRINERVYLSASDDNGITAEVYGEKTEAAVNRPADEEFIQKQLSKLGGTIYRFGGLTAEIQEGAACTASQLNSLRREVCAALDKKRYGFFTKKPAFTHKKFDIIKAEKSAAPELRVSVRDIAQLSETDWERISLAVCPLRALERAFEGGLPGYADSEKLAAEMPRFTFDEKKDFEKLKRLKEQGIAHIVCTNYAHISMGRELGMTMHGGFGLNAANSLALEELKRLGLSDCIVSFELKAGQINELGGGLDFGIIGYGRLPLMLAVNCPVKQSQGCKNCTHGIWDRTKRFFPIRCSKEQGYVEMLNSDVLYIGDKLDDFRTAKFIQLDFFDEAPEQTARITETFMAGEKPEDMRLTRGLYYRGIL